MIRSAWVVGWLSALAAACGGSDPDPAAGGTASRNEPNVFSPQDPPVGDAAADAPVAGGGAAARSDLAEPARSPESDTSGDVPGVDAPGPDPSRASEEPTEVPSEAGAGEREQGDPGTDTPVDPSSSSESSDRSFLLGSTTRPRRLASPSGCRSARTAYGRSPTMVATRSPTHRAS